MITVIMVIIRKLFDFYRHSSRVRGHIIVLGNDENFSQWFCAVFYFFLPLTFHKNEFQCKFSTRSRFHIPRIHRYTPKSAYTQKKASAEVNLLQTVCTQCITNSQVSGPVYDQLVLSIHHGKIKRFSQISRHLSYIACAIIL